MKNKIPLIIWGVLMIPMIMTAAYQVFYGGVLPKVLAALLCLGLLCNLYYKPAKKRVVSNKNLSEEIPKSSKDPFS